MGVRISLKWISSSAFVHSTWVAMAEAEPHQTVAEVHLNPEAVATARAKESRRAEQEGLTTPVSCGQPPHVSAPLVVLLASSC